MVNRHPDAPIEATLRLPGLRPATSCTAQTVDGPDVMARNTFEQLDLVQVARSEWQADALRPSYTFPAHLATLLTIPLH